MAGEGFDLIGRGLETDKERMGTGKENVVQIGTPRKILYSYQEKDGKCFNYFGHSLEACWKQIWSMLEPCFKQFCGGG